MRPVDAFLLTLLVAGSTVNDLSAADAEGSEFFEKRIRPILVDRCYECHSEAEQEQQGGLLLDRESGWLTGGDTDKAVIPGEPDSSLLFVAVTHQRPELSMPPDERLEDHEIDLLRDWIRRGAPGPSADLGDTEFSRLGDQDYLFDRASDHWAFQPVDPSEPPDVDDPRWNRHAADRYIFQRLCDEGIEPAPRAGAGTIYRRLSYALTGLPPTIEEIDEFERAARDDFDRALRSAVDHLIASAAYGQHLARLWLDVARYADTDSAYRPDTRTPHYFPFAFTYRDYVVEAFNADKPFDRFVIEQFAADQIGFRSGDPQIAALGFFGVGPHANRAATEALDDWIDVTTRGLMGLTVACARCHDHKYEPVPTEDYYALRGVFASLRRPSALDEQRLPEVGGYEPSDADRSDYEKQLSKIQAKIDDAGESKAKNNNRSIAQKIRETELAELMLFHPGGPAHAMVVQDLAKPARSFVHLRGDAQNRGDAVSRRFVRLLDPEGLAFSESDSGRHELAQKIVDRENPLTARVYVNRVWGHVMGRHLVATPSDFGLQGSPPSHPKLLDWLTHDFIRHDWSTKHLVRRIVLSEAFLLSSQSNERSLRIDPQNRWHGRAERRRLSIEMIRDSLLAVADRLDATPRGRPGMLWGDDYTRRRAIYGFINRFNLDPTLRAFDFPAPMQTHPGRGESIVASQTLFTMNSPFVIDQASAVTEDPGFRRCGDDRERIEYLFAKILQRAAADNEIERIRKYVQFQNRLKPVPRFINSPWPLIAQSLMMSNEFQYVD